MKYIRIGKIVNTHGVKGELRLLSDFKFKNKVFVKNFKIYIGKQKQLEVINSYRHHKIFDMITLVGYSNINEVLKYKGDYVFIDKDDLILDKDEFLEEDLIGFKVIYEDFDSLFVDSFSKYQNIIMLKVNNNGKINLIPLNNGIISKIDLEKKEIILNDIKGLIE